MHDLSLSHVLHRSHVGQSLRWGDSSLPPLHEHLLLRLNGYTPLRELRADSESEDQMLDAAADLLRRGLADVIDTVDSTTGRTPSGWMDLLANG